MFDSSKKKIDSMVFHEGDYIANEKDRTFEVVGIIKNLDLNVTMELQLL